MACFDNFITVRAACSPDTPTSGYYIEDLPGINQFIAGEIADRDTPNGITLLQRKIDFAVKRTADELANQMQDYLTLAPILQTTQAGDWSNKWEDSEDYLPTSNENRGVEICIQQTNMARIYITRLELLTNTTLASKTITIRDIEGTTNYTVDLTAKNIAEVEINKEFKGDRVWIYWNTSDIEVNDSRLRVGNCSSCGSNTKGYKDYANARVRGKTDSLTSQNATYGIRANFSINCSADELLCSMKPRLNTVMLYATGIAIIEEWLYSDRNNATTNLHTDQAQDMLEDFTARYEGLLKTYSRNAQKYLSRYGGACVDCRTPRQRVTRM